MVKKNTNEHDYYKPLNAFLTYHFGKTPGNETKLANVLHYCKTNWAQISEHELDNGDLDLNVQTLLEIQPMDIASRNPFAVATVYHRGGISCLSRK